MKRPSANSCSVSNIDCVDDLTALRDLSMLCWDQNLFKDRTDRISMKELLNPSLKDSAFLGIKSVTQLTSF